LAVHCVSQGTCFGRHTSPVAVTAGDD
jgi:hypothetical protein